MDKTSSLDSKYNWEDSRINHGSRPSHNDTPNSEVISDEEQDIKNEKSNAETSTDGEDEKEETAVDEDVNFMIRQLRKEATEQTELESSFSNCSVSNNVDNSNDASSDDSDAGEQGNNNDDVTSMIRQLRNEAKKQTETDSFQNSSDIFENSDESNVNDVAYLERQSKTEETGYEKYSQTIPDVSTPKNVGKTVEEISDEEEIVTESESDYAESTDTYDENTIAVMETIVIRKHTSADKNKTLCRRVLKESIVEATIEISDDESDCHDDNGEIDGDDGSNVCSENPTPTICRMIAKHINDTICSSSIDNDSSFTGSISSNGFCAEESCAVNERPESIRSLIDVVNDNKLQVTEPTDGFFSRVCKGEKRRSESVQSWLNNNIQQSNLDSHGNFFDEVPHGQQHFDSNNNNNKKIRRDLENTKNTSIISCHNTGITSFGIPNVIKPTTSHIKRISSNNLNNGSAQSQYRDFDPQYFRMGVNLSPDSINDDDTMEVRLPFVPFQERKRRRGYNDDFDHFMDSKKRKVNAKVESTLLLSRSRKRRRENNDGIEELPSKRRMVDVVDFGNNDVDMTDLTPYDYINKRICALCKYARNCRSHKNAQVLTLACANRF